MAFTRWRRRDRILDGNEPGRWLLCFCLSSCVIWKKLQTQLGRKPILHGRKPSQLCLARNTLMAKKWSYIEKGANASIGQGCIGNYPRLHDRSRIYCKGRGETIALNSASHGAGRKLSRSAAMASVTHEALQEELQKHQVKLIGGGLDEAPFAYKDINTVMLGSTISW